MEDLLLLSGMAWEITEGTPEGDCGRRFVLVCSFEVFGRALMHDVRGSECGARRGALLANVV